MGGQSTTSTLPLSTAMVSMVPSPPPPPPPPSLSSCPPSSCPPPTPPTVCSATPLLSATMDSDSPLLPPLPLLRLRSNLDFNLWNLDFDLDSALHKHLSAGRSNSQGASSRESKGLLMLI